MLAVREDKGALPRVCQARSWANNRPQSLFRAFRSGTVARLPNSRPMRDDSGSRNVLSTHWRTGTAGRISSVRRAAVSAMRPFQCHLGRRSVAGRRRLNPKKERSVIAFGFGYLVDVLEAHTWIWEMKSRQRPLASPCHGVSPQKSGCVVGLDSWVAVRLMPDPGHDPRRGMADLQ